MILLETLLLDFTSSMTGKFAEVRSRPRIKSMKDGSLIEDVITRLRTTSCNEKSDITTDNNPTDFHAIVLLHFLC
jgi:hypothetical protein